jgi:hypothetical protein
MNGKLEYEYFRLQKLEKMFWNRTYGHVRIIYFSEKLTSMLMVNVLCKTKKRSGPIGDGVIKQIERYCEIRLLCFNYSLVRRYHGVYERNLQTLSEIHTRL